MTKKKQITCIVCPIGCKIKVDIKGDKVEICSGNKCKKGVDYAIYEALDPRRVLTTSVLVEDGQWPLVSVKSSKPVPKNKIFDVLKEIRKVKTKAPVKIGKTIIKDVARTGIDIISTKSIKKLS
jgi:CxxC motif-containing protein